MKNLKVPKFTVSENITLVDSTQKQAILHCKHTYLLDSFGFPFDEFEEGDEIDVMWVLEFEDGETAIIHNLKDGKNYLGEDGADVWGIKTWSLRASSFLSVHYILELLQNHCISIKIV